MKIYKYATQLMSMDEKVWKRHANPWSVWTRIPIIFFLALAAYSWNWIGWKAIIPITLIVIWIYLNPRVFKSVEKIDTWASKGVYGEKLFTSREKNKYQIEQHHIKVTNLLTIFSALFSALMIVGIVLSNPTLTIIGALTGWLFKMWFIDRMVWIYEENKHQINF